MIEQPDEAEPLARGTNLVHRQRLPSGAPHPHEAFVERRLRRGDIDDRLIDQEDAARIERRDDLLGGAHVLVAARQRRASRVRGR